MTLGALSPERKGMSSPGAWPRAQGPRNSCLPCFLNIPDSKAPGSQVVGLWKETPQRSSQALAGAGAGEGGRETCSSTVDEQPRAALSHRTSGPAGLWSSRERSQSRGPWLPAQRLGTVHTELRKGYGPAGLSEQRRQKPGSGRRRQWSPRAKDPRAVRREPQRAAEGPELSSGQMWVCSRSMKLPQTGMVVGPTWRGAFCIPREEHRA